jgi:hypothetical protein
VGEATTEEFITMRSPKETRKQRRDRKRAEWVAEHPNPYHEWPGTEDTCRHFVIAALAGAEPGEWCKGGKDNKVRKLSVDDLAVGYWAVMCTEGKGTSYGQLRRAFKECIGVGCHKAKAAAIFAALISFGLIVKEGNYSVGRKGNVYRVKRTPPTVEWCASGRS